MKANLRAIGIAYVIVLVLAILSIARIIDLQFVHKPTDRSLVKKTLDTMVLECTRGSIIASDGRYLAFSIPEYRLAFDPCQSADTLFENNIDSLSVHLAAFYKDKKASEYKKMLAGARAAGRRFLYVNRSLLTYQQMKEVSSFPIFKAGQRRGGVQFEKVDHRTYPYGRLGFRTLGYLKDRTQIPVVGIEGYCDSILRGRDGMQPTRLTEGNNWIVDFERETVPPVNGTDVQITIDVDMQDIAQTALMRTLDKTTELHAGTVILMEVATGEIKAMVNLEKNGRGGFDETMNYAIGRKGEPGSVFKAATLACMIEEHGVRLEDEVPATVNWSYGKRIFSDHYLDKYGATISIQRGFEISSNNVFRMLAAKHYSDHPDDFMNYLTEKLRITKDFPFELNGFSHANIKSTKSRSWSPADLPQIGMGYTVEITPLHTLNFYNALANNGVMVRPHLVRNYQKDGVVIKDFPTEEMATVCKPETAAKIRKAMRGVVEHEGGTGYWVFKGCPVNVAGKTGTARIVFPGTGSYTDRQGRLMHQATFVGIFPYEAPKYSMIAVVYSEPTHHNFYGATWCGPVFREITEQIYASSSHWNEPLKSASGLPAGIKATGIDRTPDGAPDVAGLGLKEAISILEKEGYTVQCTGKGTVTGQHRRDSLSKTIELTLNITGNEDSRDTERN